MLTIYLAGVIASFTLSLLVNRSKFVKETLNFEHQSAVFVITFALISWLGVATQILIMGLEWYIWSDFEEKIKDNKIVKFIEGRS